MNKIIIILIILAIYYIFSSKSSFVNQLNYTYSPESCDLEDSTRIYPSGHVPGSYLGLTPQENETILLKFIDYAES